MNWKHKFAYSLFRYAGNFYNKRRNGLRILGYHSVGTPAYRDNMNLYNVSPIMFEDHISLLSHYNNIRVISLNNIEVNDYDLAMAFTFDDGYIDNLKYVAPLMEKYNYPWHVFVVTDFIKNKKKGYMAPTELQELSGYECVTIGSHSKSHIHLARCNEAQLHEELYGSKKYLEDLLGENVSSVSYPYGSANKKVLGEARKVGYQIGCSSYANINDSNRDAMGLCRTPIFSYDDSKTVAQKLSGMWDWMRFFTDDPLHND